MLAYLLINVEKDKEQELYETINGYEEVIGSHIIFGEWDIIAKVEIENSEALGTFILDKIRPLDGVAMTSTLIVAR
ncbi:Lrp/AsnC ligand binding domain-containing protein [Candidatus Woesearchaeota archaeon]|nr:Lrp/AsnC ligand binding domain-containing protein [Candidatus Woesearchaeota archaeon]